ncbi:FAD-dependent monooxygenase [Streptomyces sp. NBC_00893]|uniref:FAD-dependent monooxygenase n=1 Tax=Streptomyces sp. NBC_00893 TaxID=2975862 RepID=UPI002256F322|nr:FAD-dependent monooxygenase [Streptomyces sp. NBC_00893]MCX4849276.1 FAD-dependent monooxygenase [Streptomyces sp. NBC_00893]
MSVPSKVSVLLVGGGPVGLTMSALLSGHGVDHLLVEARPTTSGHPKARGVSARSMEIFRRMGLEDRVREAGLPASQVFFYRGRDLVDPDFVRTGLAHGPVRDEEEHTPSPGLICSQDVLEPILQRHAQDLAGPRVRFGMRLVSMADDGNGVTASVEDTATGDRHSVRTDWVVGCDGAAGTVRTGVGIAMEGPTGLGRYLSVRFEAPLGEVVADRASASYFLTVPGRGGFMAVDNDRHWIYQYPLDPEAEQLPDLRDHGEVARLIRAAAGIPDLDVSVRSTMTWRMDARLAAAYRSSRVLLAGDAAHAIPPTGGHGMNTGIGDADNLAWKLAAVVAGYAGDALLDSYEAERRPVARQVLDISTDNARNRAGYRIDDELLLTADYRSTAVVTGTGADGRAAALDPTGFHPGCAPGRRVPHVRLVGGPPGVTSTLDLVGPGFTLLTGTDSPAWRQEADAVRAATGIPVVARALDAGAQREAVPGQWAGLRGTAEADGAVLVRPDGHVARVAPGSSRTALATTLRRILSAG